MSTQLLEQARQAKRKADYEQSLIDQLPQLEAKAQQEAQQAKLSQQKGMAQAQFEQAIEQHKQRDQAFEANYKELRSAFRSFVAMLKADNRSYDNVRQAAYGIAYYMAQADDWGLTRDNVERHQEQILIDNDVKLVSLPRPMDFIDHLFNVAIQESIKTA